MSGGTPIKFGPEWLRNIGGSGDSTRPNNQNGSGPTEATGSGNQNSIATGSSRAPTSTGLPTTSSATGAAPSAIPVASGALGTSAVRQTNTPRVFLANLRYGREEMLALYDRGAAGAPEQLKYFDSLYQPRGKPPSALNAFEDEQNVQHEGLRGGVPITAGAPSGFGRGRGAVTNFGRRGAFVKSQTASRGWSRARMPGLSSGSTEEEPPSLRPWSTNSNGAGPSRTTPAEPSEWTQTKLFRNRRHAHNTNWRQSGRDEGDEWRMQEHGNRSGNPERDWPERPAQDRPQSWGSNRRPWADNQTSDDNIPEWANDNAEAGAGTFDASGAFHGYSNDDSNIPRQQETPFPLARSYTHAAFTRSKTLEEGSDEWWASEKAKKLSPKRLLSNEYNKYEKTSNSESNEPSTSRPMGFDDHQEMPEMLKLKHLGSQNKSTNDAKNQYAESKTFDALMRSDIEIEEVNDDRSNFQSVMIASNNSLRQKHQNIVASTADAIRRTPHNSVNLNMPYGVQHNNNKSEIAPTQSPEEKISEDMFEMTLDDTNLPALNMTSNMPHGTPGGMCILQSMSANNPVVQIGMPIPGLQNQPVGINATTHQVQSNIQNVGMQNSALNSSLGLPIGTPNNGVMLLQGVLPQVMANTPMNPAMNAALQQHSNVMGAFQQNLPVIPSPNIANQSLYLAQNNNQQLPLPNGHPQNPEVQNNMFPMHGTRQAQLSSIYRGVSIPTQNTSNAASLSELWFYEDPEKNIQGPFSSKEMWNWYGAGFFSPSLMVRRACETSMRPLASYGPMPFAQMDMFPLQVNQQQQSTLGIADSLWSQPSTSQEGMWMQSSMNRPESRVNNLPMYFWDSQPSAISSNTMLPEEIIKEMKTEDEILAQIRAPQNIPVSRISFSDDAVTSTSLGVTNSDHSFVEAPPVPDLTALQKIMQPEALQNPSPSVTEVKAEKELTEEIADKIPLPVETEPNNAKVPQSPIKVESKVQKMTKNEQDKAVKNKDNNGNKIKAKKTKDDKKDETSVNTEEELTKKRSVESSPSKLFKDIKPPSKKEIEKEKKELTKDGFTIVKGAEKSNKENKKKADEAKATDEAERKRKEEEKKDVVEDKKKTSPVATKKQQEQSQQKQVSDSVPKKAPWSAVATQAIATNKDGLTLTEIQKLEREKKLEQMKEQQQMMHIIAQQHAAALAREQEMQAGLGWAKKMNANASSASSQTLAEIQSETRRQAAAATAAAAAAQALEEAQAAPAVAVTHVPWGNSSIGGFWDCPNQLPKADPVKMEPTKPVEIKKSKFKAPAPLLPPCSSIKKETTPAMEFETWCSQALGFWSSKIDVPTFVGFLKDIESPYEVKDYVKCYLGESKDSSDFSRQFLERRSKLLRVGMVTPSDDLCSPALAINPRNTSMSDYQEVKGKGKKTKKNKMMKVDARILGFSVTAAEDRINVGDIDTA